MNIPKKFLLKLFKIQPNLKSCDKAFLGLFAANIRAWRQPEPYKGKEFYIAGTSSSQSW
jgi:ribosomal protein L6P/L9E